MGCVVTIAALGLMAYLTLWSRRTIDEIARKGARPAREIVRDRDGE